MTFGSSGVINAERHFEAAQGRLPHKKPPEKTSATHLKHLFFEVNGGFWLGTHVFWGAPNNIPNLSRCLEAYGNFPTAQKKHNTI